MTVRPFESLPLGFRFRPTDEELVNHYLKPKIAGNGSPDVDVIPEVDMSKCEPWDLPDKSLIKSDDPEWFYFAPIDRKYPNGYRSNRATEAGYWKATGKDRFIRTRSTGKTQSSVIGMKKTLVFHIGRAPKGMRTNWIMHEYRTTEPEFEPGENGGYVLYRLFNKQEERNPIKEDECEANGSSPVANIAKHEREELQEGPSNQQIFDNSAPTSSCIEKWLTDIPECSANNDIDQKSKNRLLDENLMHLEQVAPDGFPRVSSPLRPYTDHPFPSNLNQEDCMKLFDFNNIANQDFVNNLISSVLPDSSYQDVFDGETLNRPYELFEVQRGGNVSLEGSSRENTVEETGIRVTDRELNIDSEIPQQGNATRRFRLATRELFGGKCSEISRNDNEVLKYSGRVFIPKRSNDSLLTKLKNLSLDGACCKDDQEKLSENLTPKSHNESKRVLKIATRWHITWYVVPVILISVCVGTWRCLYSS